MKSSIRLTARASAFALATVLLPWSGGAQQGTADLGVAALVAPATTLLASDTVARAAGPRYNRAGISTLTVVTTPTGQVPPEQDAHMGAGSHVALMGVGVAAVIIGSLVEGSGGTAIQLGGGVVFFLGLFRFLR